PIGEPPRAARMTPPPPENSAAGERFLALEAELRRLRQLPAHEVPGVPWDASPVEVRAAWIALGRRFHPDNVARWSSAALARVAAAVGAEERGGGVRAAGAVAAGRRRSRRRQGGPGRRAARLPAQPRAARALPRRHRARGARRRPGHAGDLAAGSRARPRR